MIDKQNQMATKIQKNWKGSKAREFYQKEQLRKLYQFYYSSNFSSIDGLHTSELIDNKMLTPDYSEIYEQQSFPSLRSIKKQTIMEPHDYLNSSTLIKIYDERDIKQKREIVQFSFDKYVFAAIKIQKVWRGYHSRRKRCNYRKIKHLVLRVEEIYLNHRYEQNKKMKKLLCYIETTSYNIQIMLQSFYEVQKQLVDRYGRKPQVQNVVQKSNLKLQHSFFEGNKKFLNINSFDLYSKKVKESQNLLNSAQTTDRTQQFERKRSSNPYQLQLIPLVGQTDQRRTSRPRYNE